ncbi:hypothetical protein [Caulobacter sp. LARHSG274]
MGHVVHNVHFRPRPDHPRHRGHGRGARLIAVAGFNLLVWSGLVLLIAHAI